ncbi:MAG: helix-turn-helix domain-containing protein [Pseudomonadota bacterium]
MQPRRLLSYKQAAHFLNIPVGSLYALVHTKAVPHLRIGPRTVRFDEDVLNAWLQERMVGYQEGGVAALAQR